MSRKNLVLFTISLLMLFASACNLQLPQTSPTSAPTQIVEPGSTQSADKLPLTEAEVPRVSVEEAKAALDSGAAILVDVRSAAAYEASHVAGAMNIQLGEIETNPTSLELDKDQWIITYCT